MKKFTETHEWVEIKDNIATVGISDHAQHELGDIVYVELPGVGKHVNAGEEVAVLESTKAAADVYAPISGTVSEVNTQLEGHSELVNTAAESEGWLFKIKMSSPEEFDALLDLNAYKEVLH